MSLARPGGISFCLNDGDAYQQIALLVGADVGWRFAQALTQTLAEYSDAGKWSTIVEDCEVGWLAAAYGEGGPGIRLVQKHHDIDCDDLWMKETLAGMPKLQPVIILVDSNIHPVLIDDGSRVT